MTLDLLKLKKEVGKVLISGYNSVYLVELATGKVEPCLYNNEVSKRMRQTVSEKTYSEIYEEFEERFVIQEEREEFHEKTALPKIEEELEKHDEYSYTFQRYNQQGEIEYVEMCASKAEEGVVIVSFRTVTDSITQIKERMAVTQPEYETEAKGQNRNYGSRKRTILIIEDNELNREILMESLKDEFYVLTASNGEEGLRKLEENYHKLSLVLLDIQMPVMNGYEFLERVGEDAILSQIPVIVTTGNNQRDEEQKCLKLGAVDFITKPYNPELALVRIRNVIRLRESAATLSAVEYDKTTGLYTLQAFMHHAGNILQENLEIEYTFIGIEIQNYKLSNSQYGEKRCNELLSYIGKYVQKLIRHGIAGRYGDDQFIIIARHSENLSKEWLKEKVREIIDNSPIPHQSVKIGVYGPVDRSKSVSACCSCIFWAINNIKESLKEDVVYYTEEMNSMMIEEQKILECMEEALIQGQFHVYYQPKHDCISGNVVGAEALVRWNHPKFGFMSPGKFIPLFEKNGFITKLDSYMIQKVCTDIKNWEDKGNEVIPISVNVSRRDFFEEGWLEKQLMMIDEFDLDPSLLHMEVTESLYTENADIIIEKVRRIRGLGYPIEMDDFGAGYSSLGMLTEFPLDVVKLDISFVRKIEKNLIVIDAIIKLAQRMGLKTVAEGVETEGQYEILKKLGCDLIQGYYFSKPIPKNEFEQYVINYTQKKIQG